MPDLRPLFTERTASRIRPGLLMTPVASPPALSLDPDALRLLRDGLGSFDMELRWLAHLDRRGTLGLWRSWTGHQIYRATIREDGSGGARIDELEVEQHPERHTASLDNEPHRFELVLTSVINTLRRFEAGHTPYGSAAGADPEPAPWP